MKPVLWAQDLRELSKVHSSPSVMILGDSLARHFPAEAAARIVATSADQVLNLAIIGAHIDETDWLVDQVASFHITPPTIILIIGANDLTNGRESLYIASGISCLATKIHAVWPGAALRVFGLFARGRGGQSRQRERLATNAFLAQWLQGDEKTSFIDTDAVLEDQQAFFLRGDVHVTPSAYDAIADYLATHGKRSK